MTDKEAPNEGWLEPALEKAGKAASEMPHWMRREPSPLTPTPAQTAGLREALQWIASKRGIMGIDAAQLCLVAENALAAHPPEDLTPVRTPSVSEGKPL